MPRDTIRRLARDVERVLIAGAHLAAGDAGLAKDRSALDGLAAQLGAKAPVIGQLAAATAKTVGASGSEAARELVGLVTMAAQVKAAQAQPAPTPALSPLTPTPPLGTPCDAKDLGEIYAALVERGKGRMEVIRTFAERGDIADLRLVDALVYAMSDAWIGEVVTSTAIPKMGPAIVAPIRALLDIGKGRIVDGRRLRALVAVQKAAARELLVEALTRGNAEMREAAFDAVADELRGDPEFESLVLEAVRKERVGGVRRAALRAVAGYASAVSLDALVEALDDTRTLAAAGEGLGASTHPQVIDRLLARLSEAVASAKKPGPEAPAGTQVAPKVLVEALLGALAKHRDPRIAAAALPLLDEYGPDAAAAVVPSGDPRQLARVADRLAGTAVDFFYVACAAALALGPKEAFARFSATFTAKDRETSEGQSRLTTMSRSLRGDLDGRWPDFCLKQLSAAPHAVARHAMPLIAALKDRRALKPLLGILATATDTHTQANAIRALGALGDPAAIDLILARAGTREWMVTAAVREAIIAINDVSAVAKVRTIYVAQSSPTGHVNWQLRSLLQHLEQRFPGH